MLSKNYSFLLFFQIGCFYVHCSVIRFYSVWRGNERLHCTFRGRTIRGQPLADCLKFHFRRPYRKRSVGLLIMKNLEETFIWYRLHSNHCLNAKRVFSLWFFLCNIFLKFQKIFRHHNSRIRAELERNILKFQTLPFSVFPRCQCVYTHKAGRTPALEQNWQWEKNREK